jgi:hypothetical protein
MRYLAELPQDKQVGGVLLVAAWFNINDAWESLIP